MQANICCTPIYLQTCHKHFPLHGNYILVQKLEKSTINYIIFNLFSTVFSSFIWRTLIASLLIETLIHINLLQLTSILCTQNILNFDKLSNEPLISYYIFNNKNYKKIVINFFHFYLASMLPNQLKVHPNCAEILSIRRSQTCEIFSRFRHPPDNVFRSFNWWL